VLGLTGTTLMRKIDRLEEELGFKRSCAINRLVAERRRTRFAVRRRTDGAPQLQHFSSRLAVDGDKWLGACGRDEGPGLSWILPRLIDFQKTYRKIMVDLRCAMEQADVSRLEADISIQLARPTNPDLIVTKLGRHHIYAFCVGGLSRCLRAAEIARRPQTSPHRQQHGVQLDETAMRESSDWNRSMGSSAYRPIPASGSLRDREGRRDRISADVGDGTRRAGRADRSRHQLSHGFMAHLPQEFRNSDRHKIVIDWLKKIFDPKAIRVSATSSSTRTSSFH